MEKFFNGFLTICIWIAVIGGIVLIGDEIQKYNSESNYISLNCANDNEDISFNIVLAPELNKAQLVGNGRNLTASLSSNEIFYTLTLYGQEGFGIHRTTLRWATNTDDGQCIMNQNLPSDFKGFEENKI
jgi:hypothetical protein